LCDRRTGAGPRGDVELQRVYRGIYRAAALRLHRMGPNGMLTRKRSYREGGAPRRLRDIRARARGDADASAESHAGDTKLGVGLPRRTSAVEIGAIFRLRPGTRCDLPRVPAERLRDRPRWHTTCGRRRILSRSSGSAGRNRGAGEPRDCRAKVTGEPGGWVASVRARRRTLAGLRLRGRTASAERMLGRSSCERAPVTPQARSRKRQAQRPPGKKAQHHRHAARLTSSSCRRNGSGRLLWRAGPKRRTEPETRAPPAGLRQRAGARGVEPSPGRAGVVCKSTRGSPPVA